MQPPKLIFSSNDILQGNFSEILIVFDGKLVENAKSNNSLPFSVELNLHIIPLGEIGGFPLINRSNITPPVGLPLQTALFILFFHFIGCG